MQLNAPRRQLSVKFTGLLRTKFKLEQLKDNKGSSFRLNDWQGLILHACDSWNANKIYPDKQFSTKNIPSSKNKMYLLKINPWVNLEHWSGFGPSKPSTDYSCANKHNKSGTHSKPNNGSDQIHTWTQHLPLPTPKFLVPNPKPEVQSQILDKNQRTTKTRPRVEHK